MTTALAPTLAGRRAAGQSGALTTNVGQERCQEFKSQLRAAASIVDGKDFVTLEGYASVVNSTYKMWDWYGEYDEQIASTAFDTTLAASPDVAYLLNHTGMTMARTTAGTLTLSVDETGLLSVAQVNPKRSDVRDLVIAVEDGAIDQMSFAFRIVNGRWNEEYTMYTITEVDIDRGDVSAVNYGANPATSMSARAKQALDAIDHLDGAPLVAAAARATARLAERDTAEPAAIAARASTGRNAATLRAQLELDEI
jgi:HK97 family phage prohead protease